MKSESAVLLISEGESKGKLFILLSGCQTKSQKVHMMIMNKTVSSGHLKTDTKKVAQLCHAADRISMSITTDTEHHYIVIP